MQKILASAAQGLPLDIRWILRNYLFKKNHPLSSKIQVDTAAVLKYGNGKGFYNLFLGNLGKDQKTGSQVF